MTLKIVAGKISGEIQSMLEIEVNTSLYAFVSYKLIQFK
jgi:hypothetical protein